MLTYSYTPYLSWRDVPQPFEKRVELAKKPEKEYLESDCFGTALFLAGVLPWDVCVYTGQNDLARLFSTLNKVEAMQDSSFVRYIRDGKPIEHLVYVRKINPFESFHRRGCGGYFEPLNDLSEVQSYFDNLIKNGFICGKNGNLPVWEKDFFVLPEKESRKKELDALMREIIGRYSPSG